MAVNLFGLPEPDDLLGPAQKEVLESARRLAEMTQGIDLGREHQALAARALEVQAIADRALEPMRAAEQARKMMGNDVAELTRQFASPLNMGTDLAKFVRQIDSVRRFAEMTHGIGLAGQHALDALQPLAHRARDVQTIADRALEPMRATEQLGKMMGTEFTDLARGLDTRNDLAELARGLDMRNDLAELGRGFASPLAIETELADLARQSASPLNLDNDLAEMAGQMASPLFSQPDLGGLGDLFHRIPPDFWQESERRMRELAPKAELLGRRGWTIPPRWGVTDFADVVDRISADELDDAWLEYYTADEGKEFDELIKALGEIRLLDPWRDYLDGAEYLYRSGRFAAAIPGLFAAMDGAFAAAIRRSHRKVNLRSAAVEFRKSAEYASREVSWSSLVGFTDVVYGDHKFGEAPPPRVNRHVVQHGRAMPPRPRVDCLRLLQALETLSLVADEYDVAATDPEPVPESLV
jgi:hypothetical protein